MRLTIIAALGVALIASPVVAQELRFHRNPDDFFKQAEPQGQVLGSDFRSFSMGSNTVTPGIRVSRAEDAFDANHETREISFQLSFESERHRGMKILKFLYKKIDRDEPEDREARYKAPLRIIGQDIDQQSFELEFTCKSFSFKHCSID